MARQPRDVRALELARDGAEHYPGLMAECLEALMGAFDGDPRSPGFRFSGVGPLGSAVGRDSVLNAIVAKRIGEKARPVRITAFDKRDGANWALGWHQDRVIAVRSRCEVESFQSWTMKHGHHHVQPPVEILERMVTVRIHLDDVDDGNAPLRIAPGSHRFGRIWEPEIPDRVARCGEAVCLANAGDAWLYATLVLHASDRALPGRRRRVIQIDYSADELPRPLEWLIE